MEGSKRLNRPGPHLIPVKVHGVKKFKDFSIQKLYSDEYRKICFILFCHSFGCIKVTFQKLKLFKEEKKYYLS